MKILTLRQFLQQQGVEPQGSECQEAVVMRLGEFITALEDQNPDKNRLVEIREDYPEFGTFAVRLLPQVPE